MDSPLLDVWPSLDSPLPNVRPSLDSPLPNVRPSLDSPPLDVWPSLDSPADIWPPLDSPPDVWPSLDSSPPGVWPLLDILSASSSPPTFGRLNESDHSLHNNGSPTSVDEERDSTTVSCVPAPISQPVVARSIPEPPWKLKMPPGTNPEVLTPNISDGEQAAAVTRRLQAAQDTRRVPAASTSILLPANYLRASLRDIVQQIDISQARIKLLAHQQAEIRHVLQSVEAILDSRDDVSAP